MTYPIKRVLASLVVGAALVVPSVGTAAAQQARTFTVVNNTPYTFQQLFVSATTTPDWGEDWLGNQVLGAGDGWKMTFNRYLAGQCLYDVKILGKNGEEGRLIGVDLCTVDTITFNAAMPPPKAVLEAWLTANPQMANATTTNVAWDVAPDGKSATVTFTPKNPGNVVGFTVGVSEAESPSAVVAQMRAGSTKLAADGWAVDNDAPAPLRGRGYISAGKQGTDGTVALLQSVQAAGDRIVTVSGAANQAGSDAVGQTVGAVLVDLLKTVDPTLRS